MRIEKGKEAAARERTQDDKVFLFYFVYQQ